MRNYTALFFAFTAFCLCFNQYTSGQSLFSNFKDITPLAAGVENAIIVDIDSDNDQDVLFSGRDYLAWFANNGNGNFGHNRTIIDSTKKLFEAKDYDNDGDVDIFASSGYNNPVFYLYKNNALSGFEKMELFSIAGYSYSYKAFAGDLDGDDYLNIVLSIHAQPNATYIYEENSSGSFILENTLPFNTVGMIDIDTDGDNDLVLNNNYDGSGFYSKIYKNNNNISFVLEDIVGITSSSNKISYLSDVNNDGNIDILSQSTGMLSIKFNDGTGAFFNQYDILYPYNTAFASKIKTEDLDNDSDMDIIVVIGYSSYIYKNNGGGTFATTPYLAADIDGLSSIDAGDLDGDGDKDIMYTSFLQSKIIWKKNNGTGTLGAERYITQANKYISDVCVGDLDADQDFDIVISSITNDKIITYVNDGLGNGFTEQKIIGTINNPSSVNTGDFNNDGLTDVVVSCFDNYSEGKLAFLLNNGNLNFSDPHIMNMNVGQAITIAVADMDNDGKLDVVTASVYGGIAWYQNQITSFFENIILANYYATNIIVSDIDNDQDLDIVLYGNEISWIENENNNFTNVHTVLLPGMVYYSDIELLDKNNDGYTDIVIAPNDSPTIYLYNDGLGNFMGNLETFSEEGQQLAGADFDNDGDTDLIKLNPDFFSSEFPTITYEETNGTMVEYSYMYEKRNVKKIDKIDLDNDGDLDLLAYSTMDNYASCIIWSENLSTNPTLSGIVYYDTNQNGQYDAVDYPLNNQNVALNPSAVVSYTNNNGYSYVLNQGAQSVAVNLGNDWHTTTPNPVNFTLASSQDTTINFGIYPNTLITQIKPYLTSNINRCSQIVPYYLTVVNEGTSVEPLSVVILNPDTLLNYISASPTPDSVGTNGKLYWHINNLLPSQQQTFTIFFQIPNFNSMGDILSTNADVFSYNNANTQTNHNGFGYRPIVVCSYDPNDKSVTPAGEQNEHYTLINEELFYTIRFQNTGNDTAFNIVVRDTLSANLNQNTFRPITSSHLMQTFRNSNGVVEFRFDNILLPDSTTNEPASHGFVQYAVKPQSGLSNATPINNTADIYFDANPPIVTNTTHNLMVYQIPCNIPTPINITGNNNVCNGYTEVYNVPYVLGATYNWSVERGTIISGNGTNQVTILWQDPSVGGIITVHVIKY